MSHITPTESKRKISIYIDRGGTFCDCIGRIEGQEDVVIKLLSVDPGNYPDAPTEGIRRILEVATEEAIPRGIKLDTSRIDSIRMGTTVATNALLERKGERCALLITKGFGQLLEIGHQTRPKLFDLNIRKPDVLYARSIEVEERVTIDHDFAEDKHIGEVVKGLTGHPIRILKALDEEQVRHDLTSLYQDGFRSIAVCLAHSYTFPRHELTNMIKFLPRGMSATADAYLTPTVKRYIQGFSQGFEGELEPTDTKALRCQLMQSDGGLVDFKRFSGLRAILSGPAGGVVGFARTCYDEYDATPVIGIDMGGTSTDVSRFAGTYEHVFETTTAGVTIQSPQLDINTVAAGGGSILTWRNNLFQVGPESAGAHPGPACYRKGGPLTITDANLFLGHILPDFFLKVFGPSEKLPLDTEVVREKFTRITEQVNNESGNSFTPEEVALGFINVANESMCRPIRSLTEGRGYDARNHNLAVFGGAGGQHACAIARNLGINIVIVHKYSSILSAYGMALADVCEEASEPTSEVFSNESLPRCRDRLEGMKAGLADKLLQQGFPPQDLRFELYLNMRYEGTDTAFMIKEPDDGKFEEAFLTVQRREFGFTVPGRPILIDNLRVRGVATDDKLAKNTSLFKEIGTTRSTAVPIERSCATAFSDIYYEQLGRVSTPIYKLDTLTKGTVVPGPATILDATQTIVVLPNANAFILKDHVVIDVGLAAPRKVRADLIDPVQLSVFGHRFMSIAEQMGLALQKTAVSLNIKERLDFSCAIFGPDGGLVANAPHVPVHLGSMQSAVKWQHEHHLGKLKPGDVLVTNHPEVGGTHLPDITVISPVFDLKGREIIFYTASRGHHRDIGGLGGISGNVNCVSIEEEGALIKSFKLVSEGKFEEAGITKILCEDPATYPGCVGSNSINDNLSDLKAQVAANQKGATLIDELFRAYGTEVVQAYMAAIQYTAEIAVRRFLKNVAAVRQGPLRAMDYLDDGTEIHLEVRIDPETGSADFDFTGTGYETHRNSNAPSSLVYSAIIYVMRAMINEEIPLNQGCLSPIHVIIPDNTVLSPSASAAVYTGNSSTSQRITDVVFRAFEACAASQGCMNSIQMYGGSKAGVGEAFAGFTFMYGESLCGGSGGGPTWSGASAVHTNMTNTRVSDLEILERRFPVLVQTFAIRPNSGGIGLHPGGNGAIRAFQARAPMTFSLSSDRRVHRPWGLKGGGPGKQGVNHAILLMPDGKKRIVNMGGKGMIRIKCGESIRMQTPGGGGWGAPPGDEEKGEKPTLASGHDDGPVRGVQYWRAAGSLHAYAATQVEA